MSKSLSVNSLHRKSHLDRVAVTHSGVSNWKGSAVQAMNDAQKNPPLPKLPFKRAPMSGKILLPELVAYTTLISLVL